MCKGFLAVVWGISFLASFVIGRLVCCHAQDPYGQLPGSVVAALQKNSMLDTATWSWEGNLSYTNKGKKSTFSIAGSYVRSKQKFAWTSTMTSGKRTVSDHVVRFDGSTLAESNDNKQMAWYAIEKISKTQPKEFAFSVPYFDAIGLHYPKENQSLVGGKFKSKILYLLENGAELVRCADEKMGEKQVSVVELEAAHESFWSQASNTPERDRLIYYLSQSEDYGVIRHERRTKAGKKWFESSVASISRESVEMPMLGKNVTIKMYVNLDSEDFQIVDEAQAVTTLTAKRPLLNPTNENDFVLNKETAKAGAQLIDGVTPGLQNPDGSINVFAMPASPEDLDKAIAAASVKRSVMPRLIWIIGLTVLIGGGLAVYLGYRRSR